MTDAPVPAPRIPIPTQFLDPGDAEEAISQHDRLVDDGPAQPGPHRCPQTTSGVCAVRPEGSLTDTPCKRSCGWTPVTDTAPERDAEAVEATPAAAAPPSGPQPIAAGTYAVYDDQQGGYYLVLGTSDGQVHRKHLPGQLVKMAEKLGGASPLAALFGG